MEVFLYQILDILLPVLLHFGIMQVVGTFFRNRTDAGTMTVLAALIAFMPLWYLYKNTKRFPGKAFRRTLWFPALLGIFGNAVCSGIFQLLKLTEHFSNAAQDALYQSNLWVQVVGLGLWIPFVEELIFRGIVYGKIREYFGKRAALWFSALLFALYHGNVIQILYAFPMGILLALVYDHWGSMAAPVLLHIGANLLGIIQNLAI